MPNYLIKIDLPTQKLLLFRDEVTIKIYTISTGANGIGEEMNSGKTPRGWHRIRAKIGAGIPENSVLVGRRPTGEIYSPELAAKFPGRDWMLTRILWLCGLEPGKNRFGNVDTMRRYIYIHGAPDSTPMGIPGSRGCIRMRNCDMIELFDLVPAGTKVYLQE